MKSFLLFVLAFILSNGMFAQIYCDQNDVQELGLGVVEVMPKFKGGEECLRTFIKKQINYDLVEEVVVGGLIIYVTCWVDISGNTLSHCLLKKEREDLDKEALRVAKLVKFDEPAKQRGKPIKIKYVIPVKFEPKKSRP